MRGAMGRWVVVACLVAPGLGQGARAAAGERASGSDSPRTADGWLDVAYARLRRGDLDGAGAAFTSAESAGASPQRIDLERAYVAVAAGDPAEARRRLLRVAAGPDPDLAARAASELGALPRPFSQDVYVDSFGWTRTHGERRTRDLVSTVRARFLYRPSLAHDLRLYGFGQVTRDLASRGARDGLLPQVYADNYALAGLGALTRLWQNRVGLFAQVGPAVNLLEDGRERFAVDGRGGAFLGLASAGCTPTGAPTSIAPCFDLYGEAVYVSRFDHNVIGFSRARGGLQYLLTGPVAWQALVEARGAVDRNHDYYNNFVDVGLTQRFRLLRPFGADLLVGAHGGRYLGVENRDPRPASLTYVDLRVLAATYLAF